MRPAFDLPHVVDEVAKNEPEKPWAFIPRSNGNISEGYKPFTFLELSQSVNKTARWIEANIGVNTSGTRQTITWMDRSNDIRYIFVILAAIKTGYKTLLASPRNSPQGQAHLIEATRCSVFLCGEESKPDVDSLATTSPIRVVQIPTLEELMKGDAEPYPGLFNDDPLESVIIIHTSGSTGLPKPIELRNGYLAWPYYVSRIEDKRQHMAQIFFGSESSLCIMPFFHAMGMFSVIKSILNQGPLVLPPVGVLNSAELNLEVLKATHPAVGFFPPSILEDLVDLPGAMEEIAKLKIVIYGGAPLAKSAGDRVAEVTRIQAVIGSTEVTICDNYVNEDRKDWQYFEWCPSTGAFMEESDGLHELVIKKNDEEQQAVFYTFPEATEYRTKDLYEEHPTKPGLWQYRGRSDDVIVLSNGEKFNPISFEKSIEGSNPTVKGALVVGQGRFQAALLLELNKEVEDLDAFIQELWPAIEAANTQAAAHARIWMSKIAIAKKDKSFVRTPKGSIVRRNTNEAFKDEIDTLYLHETAVPLDHFQVNASEESVKAIVKTAIGMTLPAVPKDIEETTDIFTYGIDSLQVLGFSSALDSAMPKKEIQTPIKPRTIYSNPTIQSLSGAIAALLQGKESAAASGPSRVERIKKMIEKYTTNLPARTEQKARQQKHVVILTGSTGSLGNYTLEYLIAAPDVEKIYCLNRSDAEARQRKQFESRGASHDLFESKVRFLTTDFSKDRFGLSEETYQELLDSVNLFIHNAWAVDFNMGLESFEDTHIAGTRRCVDFSAASRYNAHIVFISSIASCGNWRGTGRPGKVQELLIPDDDLPLPQGYGESKHVSSRILTIAAEQSGTPVTIVRVGQLAGPTAKEGVWNRHEWLPSIIHSGKEIRKVPRNLGSEDTVDWVPTDIAAHVLIDLSRTRLGRDQPKVDVFHLVNPHIVRWAGLVSAVVDFYAAQGITIETLDFADWLSEMKKLPLTQELLTRVPGLKILDFYEGFAVGAGLPTYDTEHTQSASVSLRELGPISPELMSNWLQQWSF